HPANIPLRPPAIRALEYGRDCRTGGASVLRGLSLPSSSLLCLLEHAAFCGGANRADQISMQPDPVATRFVPRRSKSMDVLFTPLVGPQSSRSTSKVSRRGLAAESGS